MDPTSMDERSLHVDGVDLGLLTPWTNEAPERTKWIYDCGRTEGAERTEWI